MKVVVPASALSFVYLKKLVKFKLSLFNPFEELLTNSTSVMYCVCTVYIRSSFRVLTTSVRPCTSWSQEDVLFVSLCESQEVLVYLLT
jgi:hypothetical protein